MVGFVLLGFGLHHVGRWPQIGEVLLWLGLLICGFIIAYSLWFFVVTWSVWAAKLDAVAVLFDPMMQMARFPVQIYPQRLQIWLMTALPVAFLTTFPAEALLGKGRPQMLPIAMALAAFMVFASHRFFRFALRFYSSASS